MNQSIAEFLGVQAEKQRLTADNLMEKLRLLDPTCVVAGGCVRDWFTNKPGKDIDIFMYDGGYPSGTNKSRIEKVVGIKLDNLSKEYTNSVTDNHISAVFEGYYENQLINIILWKKKTFNVTSSFPAYNVKMHYLPEYQGNKLRWLDSFIGFSYIYCKEIYVDKSINHKYWEKLRSKFPDCKIIKVEGERGNARMGDVRKALNYISDLGCPTEAEIHTVNMLMPTGNLNLPWVVGIDITDEAPLENPNVSEVKGSDTTHKEIPW